MSYDLEKKLVVAIASSALFDLSESDGVFKSEGEKAYRKFQIENMEEPLKPGVAFPFIKRLLGLNKLYAAEDTPVEVIFLSKNDPDSGRRIFRSAQHYNLPISRGAFLTGGSPHRYIPAFSATLFLSADREDVELAIAEGHPAGVVLPNNAADDEDDTELRIAFDFDGVLADDEAERVFKETKNVDRFHESESEKKAVPHNPGPLKALLEKISRFQKLERRRSAQDKDYKPALRVAIITARNAPSNERFVTTMVKWGIEVDETFFLGGIEKSRILNVLKPHIFFDDQLGHLEASSESVPSVHIPFGVANSGG